MLRMGLNPLRAHKYKSLDTSDPFCIVCESTEDTEHYLLKCKSFTLFRATMLQNISLVANVDMSTLPRRRVVSIILYGKDDLTDEQNSKILQEVVKRLDTT